MKWPRPRVSVKAMLALVLFVAFGLKWAVDRPYPWALFASAAWYVAWSDGTSSVEQGPGDYEEWGTSWAKIVRFPDGRIRFYVTVRPAWPGDIGP